MKKKYTNWKIDPQCKGCGETLERLVFDELPEDIKEKYADKPKEKDIWEAFGYICKGCGDYYLIR